MPDPVRGGLLLVLKFSADPTIPIQVAVNATDVRVIPGIYLKAVHQI